eukprot:scaffold5191_cov73-Skeletonema_marinoi.AAC.2
MLSLHVFESFGEFSFREVLPTDPVNLVANYAHVLRHFLPSGCTRSRTTSALTHLNTLESISTGQGACDIQSSMSQMLSLTLRRSRLIRFSHRVKWSAVSNRPQLGQPECLSAVPFNIASHTTTGTSWAVSQGASGGPPRQWSRKWSCP